MFRRSLTAQLAAPAVAVALAGICALVVYAGSTAKQRTVDQLVETGIARLGEYRELRRYYTEEVVAPANAFGLQAEIEHGEGRAAIPLPATMIQELSERLRARGDGFRLDLYSPHPFPGRSDRELDAFALAAIDRFQRDPNGYYRTLETIEGERYVRVALADRMESETCVQCHNGHPDTPRTGWKLGDVRGVLEVDIRAEDALAAAERLQWDLLAGGAAVGLALLGVVGLRMRRVSARLGETVDLLSRVADGDLDVPISTHEPDELGAMKGALEVAIGQMRSDMESLHLNRVLMESLPVGLLLCDPEGTVRYVNPAARSLVATLEAPGVPSSPDLVGADVSFLFGGREAMSERLGEGRAESFRGVLPVGEELLEVALESVIGLDGRCKGKLATFEIVTDEQRNAIRLRESIESERETADQLRESIERERERADADGEVAAELRQKADQISEVVVAAAGGDLTRRIGLDGDSPMDQVARDLDLFLEDFGARIMQVREVANELSATGRELDNVGKSLVEGARRTSDEVGSVARAWNDTGEGVSAIDERVGRLAKSYANIAESASVAAAVVASGVDAAEVARGSIAELDRSTEEIQIILTVIDQIADQSRLLALNASIEAARAGESGRGFNVVAQEVKKLASRTEEATREIARTVAQILDRGDRSGASIRAMSDVMDRVETNQALITDTMVEQQGAAHEAQEVAQQIRARSAIVAASIAQLSEVAESNEADAAGTDREAHKVFELARQIGELTARFEC